MSFRSKAFWTGFVEGFALPLTFVVWLWKNRDGKIEIRFIPPNKDTSHG